MQKRWIRTKRLWLMSGEDLGEGVDDGDNDPYLGQLVVARPGLSLWASVT
jgi:hypothetical protein